MAAKKKEGVGGQMARIRAIRRRARSFPRETLDKRLEEIEMLASGAADPSDLRPKTRTTAEIAERMEETTGRNRKKTGGRNRAE